MMKKKARGSSFVFRPLLLCSLAIVAQCFPAAPTDKDIERIKIEARSQKPGTPGFVAAWDRVLVLNPRDTEAHVRLGWHHATLPGGDGRRGYGLLEASFDPERVTPVVNRDMPQTYVMAALIGRRRSHQQEYAAANRFANMALEMSRIHGGGSRTEDGDVCIQMQLATMLDWYPESTDAADRAMEEMTEYADKLLNSEQHWMINDKHLSRTIPFAMADPYVHCMLSAFSLSFYYRADVAAVASRHYEMAKRGWPALSVVADHVHLYEKEKEHPCINRKIRLAVVSASMTEGHSNSESFGGMLQRLDRDIFQVTYVYVAEKGDPNIAKFTEVHPRDGKEIYVIEEQDRGNGAWTHRIGEEMEWWLIDIVFYLDLTMSSWARRLGMQRLAPVQVNSNGHPITSGHPQSVVQYFISWGAAELPLEEAQAHYTEELKLIPSDIFYQYYERRILPGDVSRRDRQPFGNLTRADFGLPEDRSVYLCMQQAFKFQPEFDPLLCGISKNDPDGLLVLHKASSQDNQKVIVKRLTNEGCDLARIMFLDFQPHHRLLALYRLSTVVLDSYPAGGDTTTREVLEMGKPLVTLPARLLGGRWALGYMNAIGLREATKRALIASSPGEYADLAVRLGTDPPFREAVEANIREKVPNLFQREEAVAAWQDMFLEISPYRRCGECGGTSSRTCAGVQ